MLGKDVFNHRDVQLPLTRSSDDYTQFVEDQLNKYKSVITSVSGPDALSIAIAARAHDITNLSSSVLDVITKFTAGYPHDAYAALDGGLSAVKADLDRLRTSPIADDQVLMMYRVRRQVSPPLTREGMFHVPYELRHLVAPQRYSIQGLPCLYLAGSLYTCWIEMGMPAFSDLQASVFWVRKEESIRLVDFGRRPRWLAEWMKRYETEKPGQNIPPESVAYFTSYAVCWPVMAIASVKALYTGAPYQVEYVLPQVLLQWVTKQPNIDGVRYFSTHIDCNTDNPHWINNYIFPTKTFKASGRCDRLRKLFKMTEPMNWQLLRSIRLDHKRTSAMDIFDFEFIKGIREGYHATEFGQVQHTLNALAHKIQMRNTDPNGDPLLGDVKP